MSNVEKYLDAVRERDSIERAIKEEGQTPERLRARSDAAARVVNTYAKLTGGELGKIRRMLCSCKFIARKVHACDDEKKEPEL